MKDKRGRRLTAKQKKALSRAAARLKPDNWLCIESDNMTFTIKNKNSGKVKVIPY